MSFITFNPILSSLAVKTDAGGFDVKGESVVIINKSSGAATAVNLPPMSGTKLPVAVFVLDGKGDAGSNNITVTANGSETINGASTSVISTNYGSRYFIWNGTQWNVLSTS